MHTRSASRILVRSISTLLALGTLAGAASAATKVWDGGAGSTDLATAANWDLDTLPAASDTLQWNGTAPGNLSLSLNSTAFGAANGFSIDVTAAQTGSLQIDNAATVSTSAFRILNVTIAAGAGAFTLGDGNGTSYFTLGSGTSGFTANTWTNNSSNAATISSDTFFADGGAVSGRVLTLTGSGVWNMNAVYGVTAPGGTGTLALAKSGTGTVNMNAANATYSAGTTINAGVLRANASQALGTGTVLITGNTGNTSRLELNGGITLNNAITQNGRDATLGNAAPSIVNVAGNNTLAGTVTLQTGGGNSGMRSDAGTLTLSAATALTSGTGATGVRGVSFGGAGNFLVSGAITNGAAGTMNIDKTGSGTMTLTGTNTFNGALTVGGGTLAITGSGSVNNASGITVNGSGAKLLYAGLIAVTPTILINQGALDGTGTVNAVTVGNGATNVVTNGNGGTGSLTAASLTFNGAATLTAVVNGAAGIVVTGALTTTPAAGQVTLNGAGVWINGLNNLLSFGSFTGSLADFSKGTFSGLTGRQSADSLQLVGNAIALNVIGDTPVWAGTNGGLWQQYATGSSASAGAAWKLQSAGTATDFWTGDNTIFDDTASGTGTATLHGGNVSASLVTFNNATKNYTLVSDDNSGIAAAVLVKNGAGRLTIATANTFSGGTTLNTGTLVLDNAAALGSGPLSINGGTLDSNTGAVLANNNPVNWNGDFAFTGTSALDLGSGAVSAGGTGDRSVTVSANTLTVGELKTVQGINKLGAGTLVLSSTGAGAAASVVNGTLNVAAGTVQFNRPGADANGSGDLTVSGLSGNGTVSNGAAVERWLILNSTGTGSFAGALSNGGAGGLGFSKQGTGTFTLGGNNAFSGATTLGGGTLILTGTNSLGGPVNITSGVLSIQNSAALGTATVTANNRNGGIQLQGGITLPASVGFVLSNDGGLQGTATVLYALDSVSGNNTVNGSVLLTSGGGGSVVQSDSGALTLAGTVSTVAGVGARTVYLQGASTAANTVSGPIINGTGASDVLGVTKTGSGSWIISGMLNGYTGATTVSGGTLSVTGAIPGSASIALSNNAVFLLGGTAPDRLKDSATVSLSTGRFGWDNTAATGSLGETVGALSLAGSSIIDLGTGAFGGVFSFADSSASPWTAGVTLSIYNWSGNATAGGGLDQLFFGNSAAGLTGTQLAQVTFYSDAGVSPLGGAQLLSTGELVPVPVPEPSALLSTLLGGAAVLGLRRRKRK